MQPQTMQREASFFERGCQYYVAGRYAVAAGLNPVAANLLHHAIEFLLKGTLAKTRTLDQLRRHLHKLPPLWNEFKMTVGGKNLDRFDAAITALHAFEDLRYPDEALKNGMASVIKSHRLPIAADFPQVPAGVFPADIAADVNRRLASLPKVPGYELCLQDYDELIEAIFKAAKWDPRFFFNGMNPKARETLKDGNQAKNLIK
jgi:hypothetical protein